MTVLERQDTLMRIAKDDAAFQAWEKSYRDSESGFMQYADAQSEELRNILYGYAESGRLMYQRLVNLACEHMVFPDK